MDLGARSTEDIDAKVRYAHTDILSTRIVRGQPITVRYDETLSMGRIDRVTDLLTMDSL